MIRTELVHLREFRKDDLQDVHEYCSQEDVGEMAGWKHHTSLAYTRLILYYWIKEGYRRAIVTNDTNKVIGHITVNPDEDGRLDVKEIGFVLNRDYQNKGIVSSLLPLVAKKLFSNGIKAIEAVTYCENIASQRVLEKCGFKYCGKEEYHSYELKTTKEVYVYCLEKPADML